MCSTATTFDIGSDLQRQDEVPAFVSQTACRAALIMKFGVMHMQVCDARKGNFGMHIYLNLKFHIYLVLSWQCTIGRCTYKSACGNTNSILTKEAKSSHVASRLMCNSCIFSIFFFFSAAFPGGNEFSGG